MHNVNNIIQHTILLEGGYVNNLNDSGGETKYGISKKSYPNINISELTIDEAIAIYKRDFWDKPNIDLLINERVARKVFDMGVNMGAFRAVCILQDCVGAKIDGILGDETARLANSMHEQTLIDALRQKQLLHYASIIKKNTSQIEFLHGWINRAFAT